MNVPLSQMPARPRNRIQLLLLAMLFFLPLLASFVLYFYFPDLRPSGTTNYGELIAPARPAPELQFSAADGTRLGTLPVLAGRWSFVTLAGGADCDADCERRLVMTRQVRIATGGERTRIQRVLVLDDASKTAAVAARLAAEHPDLRVVADLGAPGHRLADFLGERPALAFLFDPHTNWVLSYPAGRDTQADFKGLQKDIKKLLRLSQIG